MQRLHNYTRKRRIGKPEYNHNPADGSWKSTVKSECLGVDRLHKLTIQVDGTDYGVGEGNSIKEADDAAAKQALIFFQVSFT